MTDPDLQQLADLWRESNPADQVALEAMARKARRQGRMLAYADVALFVLIAGGTFFAVALKPSPVTAGIAIAMLLSTTYIMWKRRTIRQMSPSLDTADRRAFLISSVKLGTANVRRITLSLTFLPLGIALASMFKIAMRSGGHIEHPLVRFIAWGGSTRGIVTLSIGLLFMLWTYRARVRAKAELSRLLDLQKAYEDETLRDGEDAENSTSYT